MASEDSYNGSSSEEDALEEQSPPPRIGNTSSLSDKVNQILKKLDGMGEFSPKVAQEEAEKESNIGYRKGPVKEKMKLRKRKGKGKVKIPAGGKGKREAAIVIDSDSENSGKMFKVAAVLAIGLNYGVRKNSQDETFYFLPDIAAIRSSAAPKITTSELEIAKLTPLGLAARDVEFNTAWTFEKVELRLRKVLPILFHYFDSLSPRDDGLPHWALACRGQNRVAEVYPVTHPNGQNLHDIKGRHGRPVKECFIILVPRVQIFDRDLKRSSDKYFKLQATSVSDGLDSPTPSSTKRKVEDVATKLEEGSESGLPSRKIGRTLRTYTKRSQLPKANTGMFVQGSSGLGNVGTPSITAAVEPTVTTPLFLPDSPTPIRTPSPPPEVTTINVISPPSATVPGGSNPWRLKERHKTNFD